MLFPTALFFEFSFSIKIKLGFRFPVWYSWSYHCHPHNNNKLKNWKSTTILRSIRKLITSDWKTRILRRYRESYLTKSRNHPWSQHQVGIHKGKFTSCGRLYRLAWEVKTPMKTGEKLPSASRPLWNKPTAFYSPYQILAYMGNYFYKA